MLLEMRIMRNPFRQITTTAYRSMNTSLFQAFRAGILTLLFVLLCSGCAMIKERYGEHCKFRAYTKTILEDFITTRYVPGSPVRMAVIPFSVQANLAGTSTERPGMGNQLAWMIQAEMLRSGIVPIVEVFNRQDWPRKKEEFFTGNFEAINMARDAGYDLLMVGFVNPVSDIEYLSAEVKIIEVESGTTIWYGSVGAMTWQQDMHKTASYVSLEDRRPDMTYTTELMTRLSRCIVEEATSDRIAPE